MAVVKSDYILTLPCDSPVLADNFVERFIETHNREGAPVCVAHDGERLQPVYALIDTGLLDDLKRFLESGERKIDRWYAQYSYAIVDFSAEKAMFENINTPEDRQRLLEQ
jgi:molybdopterin-guanine dinucleotide biosynthesis protein A